MRTSKSSVAFAATLALILTTIPAVSAADLGARLEGRVVGSEGAPVAGYSVHLIEPDGDAIETAVTDDAGLYTFAGLPSGEYGLGVTTPSGEAAPVIDSEVKLGERQLARRDIRMMQGDASQHMNFQTSGGLGYWWAGLAPAAKAGLIVGVIAIVGYGISELDDDDEPAATPTGGNTQS